MRRRLLMQNDTINAVAILVSENGAIKEYFDSCQDAAAYATVNSDTNWHLIIKSGDVPNSCFNAFTNLISLTLEEGVTSIGDNAFCYCSELTGSLTIPGSVTNIGDSAFRGCSGFTGSLTILEGVADIADNVFRDCSGFTGDLVIPDSAITIGEYVFISCTGFTGSLTIGQSVISIGNNAFRGCSGFTGSLTIGQSVVNIGEYAFYYCSGFTGSLIIPDSVTDIGDSAFRGCSGLTGSLTIGQSVRDIGESVFRDCSGLTGDLVIPDSVVNMGGSAFMDCSGFTGSLTIGQSVTSIADNTFRDCSGLTGSLTIGQSVVNIGKCAFYRCSGLTGSLTIPDSVTSIGNYAFRSCSGLTGSLTISSTVTSIGTNIFHYCRGFTNLTIEEGVTEISDYCFAKCTGLIGSLKIPASVTHIGAYAFSNCTGVDDDLSYYGNSNPSSATNVFTNSSFTICKVPTDYEDDEFCGLPVNKSIIEYPDNIGVLLEDGTTLSYEAALNRSDLNSENVAGITFECDDFKCIIGLDEYRCYFCNGTQTITGDEDNIVTTGLSSVASTDFKGKENTDILCKHLTADSTWACNRARNSTILDGKKQGYLMSAGEMDYIFRDENFNYINTLLVHCGGTPIASNQSYFASTLYGFSDGYLEAVWYMDKASVGSLDGCNVQNYFYIRVLYEYD